MTQVAEFPHTNKNAFVLTRTLKASIGKTHFYKGNLKDLVFKIKNEAGTEVLPKNWTKGI